MIPQEVKNVIDQNFDMIALATKNLGVTESEFDVRFPEILNEVIRMQLDVYNKLTTRKDLYDNATSVIKSKVWMNFQLTNSLKNLDKLS